MCVFLKDATDLTVQGNIWVFSVRHIKEKLTAHKTFLLLLRNSDFQTYRLTFQTWICTAALSDVATTSSMQYRRRIFLTYTHIVVIIG